MKKNLRVMLLLSIVLSLLFSSCGFLFSKDVQEQTATQEENSNEGQSSEIGAVEEAEESQVEEPRYSNEADAEEGNYVTEGEVVAETAKEELSSGEAEDESYPRPIPTQSAPNDDPYGATFFENYGVNPMIDTEDDHFSTFAVDVDSGSYTIARRWLNDGYMPDKDSVRVEEFVNYFDQGYDYPEGRRAFTINLDGGPAPFTESSRYQILRVGLQGYTVDAEDREDVSLTFVIDVSGSMDMENRLGLVKQSLELLVDQLGRNDRVSIVVYGTDARAILEPTSGNNKEEIIDAIYRLQPEGSTNAEAGIKMGYKMAMQGFLRDGLNRVILCSDGVANVGNTGADSIWEQVEHYASEGVTLTTIGFGMGNYNDVLMEQLADQGDGFYAYIDTYQESEKLFLENLTSTLQVIALDAKVQVEFNPEVVARYRLIGFENRDIADEDFRNDEVDAGEIGAGHNVTALYEFKLFEDARGEVANVMMRWEDPKNHEITEINESIHTRDLYDDWDEASRYFQWDVLTAEFAEVLRESYWAQDVTFEDILEELEGIGYWYWDEDEDRYEMIDMIETAAWLSQ